MPGFFKTLRRKLKIKISLLKQRRKRNNLYPRIIPQNLWEIDLGEELTRAPSLTSLNVTDQQLPEEFHNTTDTAEDYSDSETDSVVNTEEALPVPCQKMQWATDNSKHVQLVELSLSPDSMINGRVMVSNLAYHKNIFIRWTADNWATFEDQMASYEQSADDLSRDYFVFSVKSPSSPLEGEDPASGVYVELAVAYQVGGMEFWDNNSQQNFGLLMKCNLSLTF